MNLSKVQGRRPKIFRQDYGHLMRAEAMIRLLRDKSSVQQIYNETVSAAAEREAGREAKQAL